VVIGPKATVDGSVIATHNADCMNCDFRIARTPAMTHAAGSSKSVLKYKVLSQFIMFFSTNCVVWWLFRALKLPTPGTRPFFFF
jgi:hypothetical protein